VDHALKNRLIDNNLTTYGHTLYDIFDYTAESEMMNNNQVFRETALSLIGTVIIENNEII
jgi:hypothetical protein